ncbi:PKD2L1 isoform 4, partial [Pan troglodytes]
EPQETAYRTRVSSCCLHICQGIRGISPMPLRTLGNNPD